MGLKVWLPLNGSLENQGLSTLSITNSGAAIDTAGKVGSCYSFNGSSAYMRTAFPAANYVTKPFSVAFWVYFNNVTGNACICSSRTGVGYGFSIFRISNYLRFDNGTNSAGSQCEFTNYTFTASKWYHVVCIQKAASRELYVDGVLRQTTNYSIPASNTAQYLLIGASSSTDSTPTGNYLNGKLNDVRIYDHALSVKEVRELARGLMVHYKLDDVRLSNANRITNYDTSFHSYADGTVTILTNQMNSGTQEIVSDIGGAHKCLHLHSNGGSNRQYTTIGASAGKSYTVSCDYYSTVAQSQAFRGELNGGDYSWTVSQMASYTTPNEWARLQFTFSNLTSAATLYYFFYCSNGTDCYIKNVKVEEGAEATPYSYTNDRPTKITDCSSYKRHGTISNTLTTVYDTSRYSSSIYFNTTASKIALPVINFSGTSTTYTFAWWQYMVNTARMAWGFSNGNRLNVYYSNPICWNTGDGTSTPFQDGTTTINPSELLNAWHHIAVTGDGAAAKIYIDGVYRGTSKTWRAITGTQIYISGWDTGTNYTWSGGKLSDFRIYATALTAADVADLYATSAEIDRNGNYYSREVIEK